MLGVGVRSIALAYPDTVRTNDWYREHTADVFARAEERSLASVFKPDLDDPTTALMDRCMAPYLKDPFRGTVERRVLGEQRSIDIIADAVARAIEAAGLKRSEIDVLIVNSFWPHHDCTGDAAWVAQKLELDAQVLNLEATCSGTLLGVQAGAAMIASGIARNVVVASGCSYSKSFDLSDSLCWFMGDGAGAMVLEPAHGEEEGILALHTLNTRATCGAFKIDYEADADGVVHRYMRTGNINTSRALRATALPNLEACTQGVLDKAGVGKDELDAFVINTPVAWFQEFAGRAWGVDPERIVSMHSAFANTGPVLTTTNLYYSVARGLLSPGDLGLVYAFGSVSNAVAAVFRWGETQLAPFEL